MKKEEDTEANSRWQPMMIVLRNTSQRLECACGALAVIAIGTITAEQNLENVEHYCQSCYLAAQSES
jgi:hypothetical protein